MGQKFIDYSQLNWGHYLDLTGLSDSFVAEKTGVSRMAINKIRRGQKIPGRSLGQKIAVLICEYLQAQMEFHKKQTEKARFAKIGVDVYIENIKKLV